MGLINKNEIDKNDEVNDKYEDDIYYSLLPPQYASDCPECSMCGEQMLYNCMKRVFKCPECGHILLEDDWEYDDTDENGMPFVCSTCGGPWPDCMTSCNMFDD